jgi:chemotaxis protein methyltransferase CheR
MTPVIDKFGDLDADSFRAIADLTYAASGIQLVEEKRSMIQSRLRHRLTALGLPGFSSYSDFVCSEAGRNERRHMISALTTNVSHFYREAHHFDTLKSEIMPQLASKLRQGHRARIWSAGCSNGQEPYSIAMEFLEMIPEISNFDFRILATDIDPKVIQFAQKGSYPEQMLQGICPNRRTKYFSAGADGNSGDLTISPRVKSLIRFKELNLLGTWPIKHRFDIIFCRNVVIYFDLNTQNGLWPRFHDALDPNGYLFLGHSERIADMEKNKFFISGTTTYRPCQASTPAPAHKRKP